MTNITLMPGAYRLHFEVDERTAGFYMDVEVKLGRPKARIRGVGPNSFPGTVTWFSKRQVYLDSIIVGGHPQFHGTGPAMVSKIREIERLPAA